MTFIEHNDEPGKPRAIETVFKNYRFRSRLEARWAVFFDALGLKWEYEPEGFDLDGVWYLPDFRVKTPQGEDIWYEIKPKGVTSDDKFTLFAYKMHAFAKHRFLAEADEATRQRFAAIPDDMWDVNSTRCNLLSGDPLDVLEDHIACPRCGVIQEEREFVSTFACGDEWYVGCHDCDAETPCGGENPSEKGFLGVECYPHKGYVVTDIAEWRHIEKHKLKAAAIAARRARFEHGEKP
jgi:hypothetical protein